MEKCSISRISSLSFRSSLWLTPYMEASMAAFYREVSGTEKQFCEEEWLEIEEL